MSSEPNFWDWLYGLKIKSLSTDPSQEWKKNAEDYYKDYFFKGSKPISTDLSWTKDVLLQAYEVTMDSFKQILVALITASFTALGGLIVISNNSSVNLNVFALFGIIIIICFIIIYLRMQFKTDINDAKLTIVLEHDCTDDCRQKHYPKSSKE
jgi:hypothetical protein